MLKKILLGVFVLLIIIQFIRPDKNDSNDLTNDISTKYQVPNDVKALLQVSCNDCHSNKTEYPWYSNIQPVGWWLNNHIVDGKRHLNFSEFTKSRLFAQNHKFNEIIETVEKDEMPLSSYTYLGLHPKANLTDDQRKIITDWARAQMDYLKASYPADSLAFPRRNRPRQDR